MSVEFDYDRLYELFPFMKEHVNSASKKDRWLLFLSGSGNYDLDPGLIHSSNEKRKVLDTIAKIVNSMDSRQADIFRKDYEFVVYDSYSPDYVEIRKEAFKKPLRRKTYRKILEEV